MARPTIYSEELANDICSRIANGESLRKICDQDGMPDIRSVMRWLAKDTEFCQQYVRAREAQADYYADELISIADDFNEGADDPTAVSRAKLRIDTRKWIASKLKPKSYGDKVTQEITGKDGGAIKVDAKQDLSSLSDEELELYERLATLRSERDKAREG